MAEETQKKEIPLKSDIEKGLRLKEFRKNFPGKMTQKDFIKVLRQYDKFTHPEHYEE